MNFRPHRLLGILVGSAVVACLLGMAAFLFVRLQESPVSLNAFLLVLAIIGLAALALLFAFRIYGCLSLRYQIDRNSLTIFCGLQRHVIPLSMVTGLVLGKELTRPRLHGLGWPGYHIGEGRVGGLGKTVFYSAHRSPKDLLYVLTNELAYGISLAKPKEFAAELSARQRLGATSGIGEKASHVNLWDVPMLKDVLAARLLIVGLLLNLALFGYVSNLFPAQPASLPLTFGILGRFAQDASPYTLLLPAYLGLAVLIGNSILGAILYRTETLASYLFLLASVAVQFLLWIALLGAIGS